MKRSRTPRKQFWILLDSPFGGFTYYRVWSMRRAMDVCQQARIPYTCIEVRR